MNRRPISPTLCWSPLLSALCLVLVTACGGTRIAEPPSDHPPEREFTQTRFQMGTLVRVTVVSATPPPDSAFDGAFAAIDDIVAIMSEWEADSDISRVNGSAGGEAQSVDPRLIEVLRTGIAVSEASAGAFDVTWAPLRHVWDFDGPTPPPDHAIRATLPLLDYRGIEIDAAAGTVRLVQEGAECGLGGIAKGTAIQAAADALRDAGYDSFVIDAGGDVYAAGQSAAGPWRVAIADPRRPGVSIDEVTLRDTVLVTSGDYERYFEHEGVRYHHIIDARTGYPARGLISVSVIAEDPTVADALATAAFILGAQDGLKLLEDWPGVEGLLVAEDLSATGTTHWPSRARGSESAE